MIQTRTRKARSKRLWRLSASYTATLISSQQYFSAIPQPNLSPSLASSFNSNSNCSTLRILRKQKKTASVRKCATSSNAWSRSAIHNSITIRCVHSRSSISRRFPKSHLENDCLLRVSYNINLRKSAKVEIIFLPISKSWVWSTSKVVIVSSIINIKVIYWFTMIL